MNKDGLKVDDTFDDVRAAFAEAKAKVDGDDVNEEDKPEDQDNPPLEEDTAELDTEEDTEEEEDQPLAAKGKVESRDDSKAADKKLQKKDTQDDDSSKVVSGPPPSWTVKSKAAWDNLPAEVKADIAKREEEVSRGLVELRDYKDLKPYADLAKQHNTTISKALDHYLGMENMLRKNLPQGLAKITENFGLNQQQAAALFLQMAEAYGAKPNTNGNTTQNTRQANPNDPLQAILKPFLEPLQNEVKTLNQKLTSREQEDRNSSEQSLVKSIEVFSRDPENRYFTQLEETITRLFETGMVPLTRDHARDLRTAYDLAAQMVPEVREALIEQRLQKQTDSRRKKEQEEAAKAKKASRSVTGSKVPGTVLAQQRKATNGHDDVEADVLAAFRLHAQQ